MNQPSPLAAAERAAVMRGWLADHQSPPHIRALVEAEVLRLSTIADGKPTTSVAAMLDGTLGEVDRLTGVVAERDRQLVEVIGNRDAFMTRASELCAAIDNAGARPQFDGNVEVSIPSWDAIVAARLALLPVPAVWPEGGKP